MPVRVKEEQFNLIKTLLNAGLNKKQISGITGFSGCTVRNVEVSNDIIEYRRIVKQQFDKKAEYDKAKEERLSSTKKLPLFEEEPKVIEQKKNSYTVTMVINVDEEHEKMVAPMTALINSMFDQKDVAVEVSRD